MNVFSMDEDRIWDLPDLHFDRKQYVAEIDRASRDDSWETDRRRTARPNRAGRELPGSSGSGAR